MILINGEHPSISGIHSEVTDIT